MLKIDKNIILPFIAAIQRFLSLDACVNLIYLVDNEGSQM